MTMDLLFFRDHPKGTEVHVIMSPFHSCSVIEAYRRQLPFVLQASSLGRHGKWNRIVPSAAITNIGCLPRIIDLCTDHTINTVTNAVVVTLSTNLFSDIDHMDKTDKMWKTVVQQTRDTIALIPLFPIANASSFVELIPFAATFGGEVIFRHTLDYDGATGNIASILAAARSVNIKPSALELCFELRLPVISDDLILRLIREIFCSHSSSRIACTCTFAVSRTEPAYIRKGRTGHWENIGLHMLQELNRTQNFDRLGAFYALASKSASRGA